MPRKYFGRLAGTTPQGAADTSPANRQSPYAVQPFGTKMLAWGEAGDAAAWNRALGAVQQNVEDVLGVLDQPAVLPSLVMALAQSDAWGAQGLRDVAMGATEIDLAYTSTGDYPVTFVKVGLHKSLLGRHLRLYRHAQADGADYLQGDNPTDANALGMVTPSDVLLQGGISSYFGTQAYISDSPHALALSIPPATLITPPGGHKTADIGSWEPDGPILVSATAEQLFLRPGCFVSLAGSDNDGFYQVASIAHKAGNHDKLVLTTGGVHRVVLNAVTNFNAGDLVWWTSQGTGQPANYAYILFVDTDAKALYLSTNAGEEDVFAFSGSSYSQSAKVLRDDSSYAGTSQVGSIGLFEQETGATSNASITVGMTLKTARTSSQGTGTVQTVRAAGTSTVFSTGVAGGVITPYAPPGFVLNPVLSFDAPGLLGGSYLLECGVLSTQREVLSAQAGLGSRAQPVGQLGIGFEGQRIKAFARYLKTGEDDATTRGTGTAGLWPNDAFTGTAKLLGENLWALEVTKSGGSDLALVVSPGDTLSFVHGVSGGTTTCIVVATVGNKAVVRDVSLATWTAAQRTTAWNAPLETTQSVATILTNTYTITAIPHAPRLRASDASTRIPGVGLDAAYRGDFESARASRGSGAGRYIHLLNGKPFTTVAPDGMTSAHWQAVGRNTSQLIMEWLGATGTVVRIAADNGTATFQDTNLATPVPLTEVGGGAQALVDLAPRDIVGGLNRIGQQQQTVIDVLGDVVLSGAKVTATTGLGVSVADGVVLSNGLERAVATEVHTLPDNTTTFVTWRQSDGHLHTGSLIPGDVPLALAVTSAGAIIVLLDVRLFCTNAPYRTDLLVGGQHAHFATLRDAVAFADAAGPAGWDHTWRILVRGPTTETDTIVFRNSGYLIEGVGRSATVSWDGDFPLFNLGGVIDLTMRGLDIRYDGTGSSSMSESRCVFDAASPFSDVTFDNVRVSLPTGMGTYRLRGFLRVQTTCERVNLIGCRWSGASDFGISMYAGSSDITIERTVLTGQGDASLVQGGGDVGGVIIQSVQRLRWVDSQIDQFVHRGLALEGEAIECQIVRPRITNIVMPTTPAEVLGLGVFSGGGTNILEPFVGNLSGTFTGTQRTVLCKLSNTAAADFTVSVPDRTGSAAHTWDLTGYSDVPTAVTAVISDIVGGTFVGISALITAEAVVGHDTWILLKTLNPGEDAGILVSYSQFDGPVVDTRGEAATCGILLHGDKCQLVGGIVDALTGGSLRRGWVLDNGSNKCMVDRMQAGGFGSVYPETGNYMGSMLADDA